MQRHNLGLYDTPPDRTQVQVALVIVALLIAAAACVAPVSGREVGEYDFYVTAIYSVVFASDLIIAAMLYAQATVYRSRALTVLASSYLASALLVVTYLLSFPGAFSRDGLLSGGVSTTAWLGFFRLWLFPMAVLPYAFLKSDYFATPVEASRAPARVFQGILGAIALAVSLTILTTAGHGLLPQLFTDRIKGLYPNLVGANAVNIALTAAALVTLFLRRKSLLDLWLLVALGGWFVEALLNLTLHGRFSLGWYCLNALVLASTLVLMLALIAESTWLYARLALANVVRERQHEVRLMSMDAVAAAIAHEVAQPLTAVTLSAKAGLAWLTREPPDPARAMQSLRDTIDSGQRSFDVIKSIRANLALERDTLSPVDLNELARETVGLLNRELAAHDVSLHLTLDSSLPPILANRVQLQRVLINLLTNAIESLDPVRARPRRIDVSSARTDGRHVLLEVRDTGAGIEPAAMARIFDPFFTTKASGTGLGLSLSRTILEEHGGRLWASPNEGCGATFHLELPSGLVPPDGAPLDRPLAAAAPPRAQPL